MFGREKHRERPAEVRVSVLCKFWQEDDVWNATAEHLPVAAYGNTFEEARRHLADAIVNHLQSVTEAGRIEELIKYLNRRAEDHMLATEISPDSFVGRLLVPTGQDTVCA